MPVDVSPKPPIPPVYLGDAVYAEFSNRMIGLMLDSHRSSVSVWLEWDTYLALKRYAQRVGWEPSNEQPEPVEESLTIEKVITDINLEISQSQRKLASFLNVQPLYTTIYKDLMEKANLKEASVWWDMRELSFSFSGTGSHLAQVFRVLRTSGFELRNERPEKKKSSWSGVFHNPTSQARIYIHFNSVVCTVKQVRTEMKEVPVYEVVCDEGTEKADGEELYGSYPPPADENPTSIPPRQPETSASLDDDIPF